MNKLVSVIMPAFNSEKYISFAIESVMEQTYDDWELIICDDGSSDKTYEIASKYSQKNKKIYLIRNKYTKGAPGARNSCLDLAKGDYVAFLDSDDIWLPQKLNDQIKFMQSENILFSYSYQQVIDEEGRYLKTLHCPSKVSMFKMLFSNFIPCVTAIYDSKALGIFKQPNITKRNDYALWLTIFKTKKIKYAYCLKKVTAKYRENSYGLASGDKLELIKYYKRCLNEYAGCSKISTFFYLIIYLFIMAIKKKNNSIYNWLITKI